MQQFSLVPPIIVDERGDCDLFETLADAERYLEPYDVPIFVAYDSEGRLLRLLPTSPSITIESTESNPSHAEALHALLVKFLSHVGLQESDLQNKTIQELVKIALPYKTT